MSEHEQTGLQRSGGTERLREALRKIANGEWATGSSGQEIARQALAPACESCGQLFTSPPDVDGCSRPSRHARVEAALADSPVQRDLLTLAQKIIDLDCIVEVRGPGVVEQIAELLREAALADSPAPAGVQNGKIPLDECLVEYVNNHGQIMMRFEDGTVLRFTASASDKEMDCEFCDDGWPIMCAECIKKRQFPALPIQVPVTVRKELYEYVRDIIRGGMNADFHTDKILWICCLSKSAAPAPSGEEDQCATAVSATNSVAQPATGTISDTGTSDATTWRTVIVGLPIIRKLLAGEDVELQGLKLSMIPDDVLWNARPERTLAEMPPVVAGQSDVALAHSSFISQPLGGAEMPPAQCWHKEVNDETGICKSCGAKAAIKLEGMPKSAAERRSIADLPQDGSSESEVAQSQASAIGAEMPPAGQGAREIVVDSPATRHNDETT
jgi:hypothetical protein